MPALHVVVLAAGKSTRMKSARPKVLHDLAGRMLIEHVLHTARSLSAVSTTLVVGHAAEEVKAALARWPDLQFVMQSPQLGTGHALLQTEAVLAGKEGTVLLLYGDVPLLSAGTLQRLLETHQSTRAAATVLTMELAEPYGYGRIVRTPGGQIERIVEERDASSDERAIREVNSGIYALSLSKLFETLHRLAADNAQGEYYLTDLVALYHRDKRKVEALCVDTPDELRGVNSRVELAEMARIVRERRNRAVMLAGVTLEDPATTYIDEGVTIGQDTPIGPGVRLQGKTAIGGQCTILAGCRLTNVSVGDRVTILDHCVLTDATVGNDARLGPFAHIRPDSVVGASAHVGNFVELKKTTLGQGSKANHLSYLGDAVIGDGVNVGAGTITCNYDGVAKHRTIIEDGAFIGSNSALVAPVTIGAGAYVGAGSTITSDVPPGGLGIARGKQQNKDGWVADKKRKAREAKS
jgi:bifunctional UDP-N-acetylglucosamine pyrophosphorylase/glucosamine-1-phosphate N-acetyltransferase